MNEITVCGQPLTIREYNGQRVVTLKDIDRVHGRKNGTARGRFNSNKKHFVEGTDFFTLDQASEIRTLGIERPQGGTPNKVLLITESGYLMLVKSFTDDLAWQVQRELVNGYFKSLEPQTATPTDELEAVKADLAEIKQRLTELTAGKQTPSALLYSAKSNTLKKRESFINCMIADLAAVHGRSKNQVMFECLCYMKNVYNINIWQVQRRVCTKQNDWSISAVEAIFRDPEASKAMMLAASDFLDDLWKN